MKKILCFFIKHKPINKIHETKEAIWDYQCERCGCVMGLPKVWKSLRSIPPPGTTDLTEWNKYFDQKEAEARQLINT